MKEIVSAEQLCYMGVLEPFDVSAIFSFIYYACTNLCTSPLQYGCAYKLYFSANATEFESNFQTSFGGC